MPAGGAAASSGVPGSDAIDLSVCINLLKKGIVLFPLFIMLIIYLIRVTLTHKPGDEGFFMNNNCLNNTNISDEDSDRTPSVILTVLTNNRTLDDSLN